jgi:hypothetical protein
MKIFETKICIIDAGILKDKQIITDKYTLNPYKNK